MFLTLFVDTLSLNVQGDVVVQALLFIPPAPTRDIVYNISDNTTTTNITANGNVINTFPTTETYTIDDLVNISANIDPNYEFISWSSDSVTFVPGPNNSAVDFSSLKP